MPVHASASPMSVVIFHKKIAVAAGPSAGSGILLEDGISFLLLESNDFLLVEA